MRALRAVRGYRERRELLLDAQVATVWQALVKLRGKCFLRIHRCPQESAEGRGNEGELNAKTSASFQLPLEENSSRQRKTPQVRNSKADTECSTSELESSTLGKGTREIVSLL